MELTCNSFSDVLEELGEMTSLGKIIIGEGVLCNFDLFILHGIDSSNNVSVSKHKISQILLSYPTYNNQCLLEIIAEHRVFNFTFYPVVIKELQNNRYLFENGDFLFFNKSDLVNYIDQRMSEDFYTGFEYLKRIKKKYDDLFLNISTLLWV